MTILLLIVINVLIVYVNIVYGHASINFMDAHVLYGHSWNNYLCGHWYSVLMDFCIMSTLCVCVCVFMYGPWWGAVSACECVMTCSLWWHEFLSKYFQIQLQLVILSLSRNAWTHIPSCRFHCYMVWSLIFFPTIKIATPIFTHHYSNDIFNIVFLFIDCWYDRVWSSSTTATSLWRGAIS